MTPRPEMEPVERDAAIGVSGPPPMLDDESFINPMKLANTVMRHRRLMLVVMTISFLVAVIPASFGERSYRSAVMFVPRGAESSGGLMGLAAQFGADVGMGSLRDDPAFFSDLLTTRQLLTTILEQKYTYRTDSGMVTEDLFSALELDDAPSPGLRLENALEEMGARVSVGMSMRTGVITFSVSMPNPHLAQLVAARMLEEVNRFNLQLRQAGARADRQFEAERLNSLRRELREAEDRLEEFTQQNRDLRNSPALVLRQDRLVRDVSFRQTIYQTVAQGYEQSRIDELNNTPVIVEIQAAHLPAKPDPRGRTRKGLMALILGAGLALAIGLTRDYFGRQRHVRTPEYQEFVELTGRVKDDVRHPLGMLPRRGS